MALKNKTQEAVRLMWNGKVKVVEPGQEIDVRDFDVENKHVWPTETVLMDKNPDTFERVANREQNLASDNVALSEKTQFLEDQLAETKENLKQAEAISEALQNQVNDLSSKNVNLTTALEEANALLAENKIAKKKK